MSNNGYYFDLRSGTSTPCRIVVADQKIYLYIDDKNSRLLIWDIRNSFFEWKGHTLVITKGDEKLECGLETGHRLEEAYHNSQVPRKKTFKFRPVHGFFLLLGLFIVSVSLLAYFYFVPWLAERSATFVPVELEVRLGETIAESFTSSGKTNDSVNYYAKQFVNQLDLDTKYPVTVTVIKSDEINAFALPGGKIFIYSGLLEKMDSYSELVALLGHELTHVNRQHSLKSILRGAASGILIGGMFGDMGGVGSWIVAKADEFKQLDYSRDLETEADNFGVQMMVQNKVDPKGMLDLLELLKEENADAPELMKYLSTHPDTQARIENISANPAIANLYDGNPRLEKNFEALKESLAHFK